MNNTTQIRAPGLLSLPSTVMCIPAVLQTWLQWGSSSHRCFHWLQIVDRDRRDAEDPWELRARREKQEFRKERDYHWQVTQAMEHWQMLNHPPEDQTDVRIMEKLCVSDAAVPALSTVHVHMQYNSGSVGGPLTPAVGQSTASSATLRRWTCHGTAHLPLLQCTLSQHLELVRRPRALRSITWVASTTRADLVLSLTEPLPFVYF